MYEDMGYKTIISPDLRYVSDILSFPSIICVNKCQLYNFITVFSLKCL